MHGRSSSPIERADTASGEDRVMSRDDTPVMSQLSCVVANGCGWLARWPAATLVAFAGAIGLLRVRMTVEQVGEFSTCGLASV
jgi:hypothetical protein